MGRDTGKGTLLREPRRSEPIGRGKTILVVDDDNAIRALTVTYLDALGFACLEADRAESALARLATRPEVALLLTDVVLPGGMNGRQLGDEVRRRHPDIKVLYMSGYDAGAVVQRGHLEPDVDFLEKPFRKRDLVRKLRQVLDLS